MNSRQTFFLMAIALPVYKLAMLPSYMASLTGRDMWFTVLIVLAVDLGVLSIIYIIKSRVGVLEFRSKAVKAVARVIAVAFCLYFILQATVLSCESVEYLLQYFFDSTKRLHMIVPLAFAGGYIAFKGEKALGRVSDIFIWTVAFTFVVSIAFNSAELDAEQILPLLEELDAEKLLSVRSTLLWFGDYLPFLFINLRDKESEPRGGAVVAGGAGIALFVSLMFAVFTMQWGEITKDVPNAFARLAGYNFISADVGKADWIAILNWLGSSVIRLSLLLVGASSAFGYAFGKRAGRICAPVSAAIVGLGLLFVVKDVQIEYRIGSELWVVGLVMNVIIPVVLLTVALLTKPVEKKICTGGEEYPSGVTDEDYMDEKGADVCKNS